MSFYNVHFSISSNTTEIGANGRVRVGSIGLHAKQVRIKTDHLMRVKNGSGRVALDYLINHQPNPPPDPADLQSLVHWVYTNNPKHKQYTGTNHEAHI